MGFLPPPFPSQLLIPAIIFSFAIFSLSTLSQHLQTTNSLGSTPRVALGTPPIAFPDRAIPRDLAGEDREAILMFPTWTTRIRSNRGTIPVTIFRDPLERRIRRSKLNIFHRSLRHSGPTYAPSSATFIAQKLMPLLICMYPNHCPIGRRFRCGLKPT